MPNVNPTMHPKSDRERSAQLSRPDIIHRSVFLDNNPPKPSKPFERYPPTPASIGRNKTLQPSQTNIVNNRWPLKFYQVFPLLTRKPVIHGVLQLAIGEKRPPGRKYFSYRLPSSARPPCCLLPVSCLSIYELPARDLP